MKKITNFLGIIAIGAVIGFFSSGCGGGDGGGGGNNPPTQTNVTATPASDSITVTWNAVPGAAGYEIIWSDGINSGNATVSNTSYIHTGLQASTTYEYIITAYDNSYSPIGGAPLSITVTTLPSTGGTAVTFASVTADGSSTQTTTQLTLTFSQPITGLSANDITLIGVSGVSKGTLNGYGSTYTLSINGFTVSGTLTVLVAKSGYSISNSQQTVQIYYYSSGGGDTPATFNSVSADGSPTQTTTQLTLTFNQPITGLSPLSAEDITLSGVSGVNKGILSGLGPIYTLSISGFTSGGILNVSVAKPGFSISNSPQTVQIYYYSSGGGSTDVTFDSVTADGSSTQTTTQLTLDFSQAITGLSAEDITLSGVSGVSKGSLSGYGPYTLSISGFTVGGILNVSVTKPGFSISNSPQTVQIYYYSGGGGSTDITFNSVSQNGSSTQTTTQLTLTFSQAITGLSAADITLSGVSGVSKGSLSGYGTTYTLNISGFTVGGTLNVSVAKSGYSISNSPQTVVIYYYSTSRKVTFEETGGSSVTDQTVSLGTSITLPTTTRSGYNLVGWFNAASGGTKAGFQGDKFYVTGNVTLYAQWASATTGMPWGSSSVTTLSNNTSYTSGTIASGTDIKWYRVTITGSTTSPVPIFRMRDKYYVGPPTYTAYAYFEIYDVQGNSIHYDQGTILANSWPSTGIYYIKVGAVNNLSSNAGTFAVNFSQ